MPAPARAALDPEASIVVIALFGGDLLDRCLAALRAQQELSGAELVVVGCGGDLSAVDRNNARLSSAGDLIDLPERLERALGECRGRFVLLTEDHLLCPPRWARVLIDASSEGRGAAGGCVALPDGATTAEWAFYFCDFFRYAAASTSGSAPALTVCSVCYRSEALRAVADSLGRGFLESTLHDRLSSRFGPLWLEADCTVETVLRGPFSAHLLERYQLGRHFAAVRQRYWTPSRRCLYALASPLLPPLFVVRMARHALRAGGPWKRFVGALPALLLLTLVWSCGELVGYVTARPPRGVQLAPPTSQPPT